MIVIIVIIVIIIVIVLITAVYVGLAAIAVYVGLVAIAVYVGLAWLPSPPGVLENKWRKAHLKQKDIIALESINRCLLGPQLPMTILM